MIKKERHSAKFKSTVALDAAKEAKTLNELASQHGVYPAQISEWKKRLLDGSEVYLLLHKKKIQDCKRSLMTFTVRSARSQWNVIG